MNRVKLFAAALVLCSTGVAYAASGNAKHGAQPRDTSKAGASCCADHKAGHKKAGARASKADSKGSCCQSGGACCASGAACCANHQSAAQKEAAESCPMDGSAKDCCAGGSCCAKHKA